MLFGLLFVLVEKSVAFPMLSSVSKHDAGMASGLMASARQIGGVVGVAIFGALISSSETSAFIRGMSHAMLFSVVCLLVSGAITLRTRRTEMAPEEG